MTTIFNTGTSALLAFQRALNTIGHNVANANTPGYSRQRVELASVGGQAFGHGFVGKGVQVTGILRTSDQYVYARALDNAAELGRLREYSMLSSRIDQMFSGEHTGLASPWSGFFDSLQGVATQPAATATRQGLLGDANSLAARFRALDGQLKSNAAEVNAKLASNVDDANRLTSAIADLNREIVRQQGMSGGHPPNDLLDQRERLVEQLAAKLGVTYAPQEDGAMNVFMPSGQALVVGGKALQLTTVADPLQPDRREIALQGSTGPVRLASAALGGEIGGLLEFRREVIDPAAAQLGRLAVSISESMNAQHRQGIDLNGAFGGDLFQPLAPKTSAHAANTGTGTLAASYGDLGALDGRNLVLGFDGGNWSATDRVTGQPVALSGTGSAADPLVVGGIELVIGGAPAAGDRFLVQPTAGVASGMQVAISDPARIAAATPLRSAADLGNLGNAAPAGITILDIAAPGFGTPADIEFIDANSYTIDGAGPFTYDPAVGIQGPGWTLHLDGPPMAGDRFEVAPRGPGSSDNGNMLLMTNLDDLAVLEGGSASMNGAVAQLSVFVGASARHSEFALEAQAAIGSQITAQRDAVSGVNLDEEAANLMRYQQAYLAAAQVISTADEMFQSLLSAVRR